MLNKKAILFDLDGTLLPMDQDEFVKYYFGLLCKKVAPLGYKPDELVKTIWAGTKEMVMNDGTKSNMKAFYDKFCEIYGEKAIKEKATFDEFYANEFNGAKAVCGTNIDAINLIKKLKENGYRIVLATNPLFPRIATLNRVGWAELDKNDFELISTYEDFTTCKPNPKYYEEVLDKTNLKSEECLMVGNDIDEDILPTTLLGIDNFLITDCLINKSNKDLNTIRHGSFKDLDSYIFEG